MMMRCDEGNLEKRGARCIMRHRRGWEGERRVLAGGGGGSLREACVTEEEWRVSKGARETERDRGGWLKERGTPYREYHERRECGRGGRG